MNYQTDYIKSLPISDPKKYAEEDKWKNKDFICPECNRTMKNKSKFTHIRRVHK